MFKHNIIIFEFNPLYILLNEIKDYFMFNLHNYSFKDFNKMNLENSIILSKVIHKEYLLKNKKLNKNKIIFLIQSDEKLKNLTDYQNILFPTNIDDLIEKINIYLSKKNFSDQSYIKVSNYILDLNSRMILRDNTKLKLTEKEINIIIFLSNSNKPQKVNILQNEVWGYSSKLETHTVETHVYRLRKKIEQIFSDKNFIISHENGYLIE